MRQKKINLKKYSFAAAKRAIKRLNEFIKLYNYNIKLIFILPERKKVAYQAELKKERTCPYCGSHLVQTVNGIVCNGDNLKNISFEIKTKREKYGDSAEMFLSIRANRFYDLYMTIGRTLECNYVFGNEEKRFKKIY
jgi:hypothetical protein